MGSKTRYAVTIAPLLAVLTGGCMGMFMSYRHDKVVALGTPKRVVEWAKAQTDSTELYLAFPGLLQLMRRPGKAAAGADAYVELCQWIETRYQAGDGPIPKDRLRSVLEGAYGAAGGVGVPSNYRVPAEFATLLDRIEPADGELHVEWQRKETHRYNRTAEYERARIRDPALRVPGRAAPAASPP